MNNRPPHGTGFVYIGLASVAFWAIVAFVLMGGPSSVLTTWSIYWNVFY